MLICEVRLTGRELKIWEARGVLSLGDFHREWSGDGPDVECLAREELLLIGKSRPGDSELAHFVNQRCPLHP